jgi:N-acylneuraminate cytidylyltransferase
MIEGRHVIALIPARGGSKSVKKKNIRKLGGKPLVAWSIEVALSVPQIDRVVVSTDDLEIASCARKHGAEVANRPRDLSTDGALVIDAIRYHIDEWQQREQPADILVLLEPTCPFRSAADISNCLTLLIEEDCDSVATFQKAEVNPHRIWHLQDSRPAPFIQGANPWKPRQHLPPAYQLNGGVYAFFAHLLPQEGTGLLFGNARGVPMPAHRSVDIDTEIDFLVAEALLEKSAMNPNP